jgi:hypothetical protein
MRGLGRGWRGVVAGVVLLAAALPATAVAQEAPPVTVAANPGCAGGETQFTFVNTSGFDDTQVFLTPITPDGSMQPSALIGQSTPLSDGTSSSFYSTDPSTHAYYFCINGAATGRLWISLGQPIPTGPGGLPGTQPTVTVPYRFGYVEFGPAGGSGVLDYSNVNDFDFTLDLETFTTPGGTDPAQRAVFSASTCEVVHAMNAALAEVGGDPSTAIRTSTGAANGAFIRVISPLNGDPYESAWPTMTPYIEALAAGGPIIVQGKYVGGGSTNDPQNVGWYSFTGTFTGTDLVLTGTVAGVNAPDPGGTPGSTMTVPLSELAHGIYNQAINPPTNYTVVPPPVPDDPNNDLYAKIYNDLTSAFAYGYWGSEYGTGRDTSDFWNPWSPPALPVQGQPAYPAKSAEFGSAPFNLYAKVLNQYSPDYAFPFNENFGSGGKGTSPLLDEPAGGEVRMTLPPDGWIDPSDASSPCTSTPAPAPVIVTPTFTG